MTLMTRPLVAKTPLLQPLNFPLGPVWVGTAFMLTKHVTLRMHH